MNEQPSSPATHQAKLERARTKLSTADANLKWNLRQLESRDAADPPLRDSLGDGLVAVEEAAELIECVRESSGDDQASEPERGLVPFGSTLEAGLYEHLRATAFGTDQSMTEILARALRREIARLERKHNDGTPFPIHEPMRIDESKYR